MRPCIALFLALVLAAACDDEPAGPADRFAGRYDWVQSTGGFAPTTRTPATEGYAVRLDFDGHGHVTARRDNAVVGTAAYSAVELPTMGPLPVWTITFTPALPAFGFAALAEETARYVSNGVIELVDPCCDGWSHTFSQFGVR